MINTIIFDLDGVLVNTKEIHYLALNHALEKVVKFKISKSDHLNSFDGLPTKEKLKILMEKKKIKKKDFNKIIFYKNKLTERLLFKKIKYNKRIFNLFSCLKKKKYKIGIATNAIKKTLNTCLKKLKINNFVDVKLCNEDVVKSKPHPEIYLRLLIALGSKPLETMILEDSSAGRIAAQETFSYLMPINKLEEVNQKNIFKKIKSLNLNQMNRNSLRDVWNDENLNVVIPMAGSGSRFAKAGYTFPKPLITVFEKPMIQIVLETLKIKANYTFLVKEDHEKKFNISSMLKALSPNCKVIKISKLTEGSACTVLLAKKIINNDNPLLLANSDQFIEWDACNTMYNFMTKKIDAGILTFKAFHPKWSYAKCKENSNEVLKVAEKEVISDNATVGIYFWKKGSDFVKYAEKMISKNDRVKNEFYICPVFNYAIKDGKKVVISDVKEMLGIGTPEDLDHFVNLKKDLYKS